MEDQHLPDNEGPEENSGAGNEQLGPEENSGAENTQLGPEENSGAENTQLGPEENSGAENMQLGPEENSGAENMQLGPEENSGAENMQLGPEENSGAENMQLGPEENSGAENMQLGPEENSVAENTQLGPEENSGAENTQLGPEESSGAENKQLCTKRKSVFDYAECSTSKRSSQLSTTTKDLGSTSMQGYIKTEMADDQKRTFTIADLPDVLLTFIFSFLPLEDLITVEKVCTLWRQLTMDAHTWKYAPLDLEKHGTETIARVPYIHTVTTDFYAIGFNVLITLKRYLKDLRKMNCKIDSDSNISTMDFQAFIKKFRSLEYIRLDVYNPAIVESLDILSSYSNLNAIRLYYFGDLENILYVCNVIACGFSRLRKLCIRHVMNHPPTRNSRNALSELIKKKISQLTNLSLSYEDVHPEILELIFKNSKLKKFEIKISKIPKISLNFGCMTSLKSLIIEASYSNSKFLNVYETIVFPKNLEILEVKMSCSRNDTPSTNKVIKNVINSLPNLKVLNVSTSDFMLNEQIENISDLQNLHTLSVSHGIYVSELGMEHILKCQQLRKLDVSTVTFTDSLFECLKECKYLGYLKLYSCEFVLQALLSTVLQMKYLTNVHLCECEQINTEGKLVALTEVDFNNVMKECRSEKHHVKVYCDCARRVL